MSGGVDSSAAALLLMKENYSLAGMTMEITESEEALATESAASVCKELSIPHFSVNISEDFKKNVILFLIKPHQFQAFLHLNLTFFLA